MPHELLSEMLPSWSLFSSRDPSFTEGRVIDGFFRRPLFLWQRGIPTNFYGGARKELLAGISWVCLFSGIPSLVSLMPSFWAFVLVLIISIRWHRISLRAYLPFPVYHSSYVPIPWFQVCGAHSVLVDRCLILWGVSLHNRRLPCPVICDPSRIDGLFALSLALFALPCLLISLAWFAKSSAKAQARQALRSHKRTGRERRVSPSVESGGRKHQQRFEKQQ